MDAKKNQMPHNPITIKTRLKLKQLNNVLNVTAMRKAYAVRRITTHCFEGCTVSSLTRRNLLQMSAGIAVASGIPTVANSAAADPNGWRPVVERLVQPIEKPQRLYIKNKRTGEVFNDVV